MKVTNRNLNVFILTCLTISTGSVAAKFTANWLDPQPAPKVIVTTNNGVPCRHVASTVWVCPVSNQRLGKP